MTLYEVDGRTEFAVKGDVVSYLVEHDGDNHYSFGFHPRITPLEEAKLLFEKALTEKTATKFDPDGGRLDGQDYVGKLCPECGEDHGRRRHGETL